MSEPNEFVRYLGIIVISGGQTGVDLAGLRAAQCLGFKTGGWAPLGWKTTDGPRPQLSTTFKLQEHSGSYASRTMKNVDSSSVTLIIAADMESAGTKMTIKACESLGTPYRLVQLEENTHPGGLKYKVPDANIERSILNWLQSESQKGVSEHGLFTLNIAGNSSLTSPGIFAPAFLFLLSLFKRFYMEGLRSMNVPVDPTIMSLSQRLFDPKLATALADNYNDFPDLNPRSGAQLLIIDAPFTREAEAA